VSGSESRVHAVPASDRLKAELRTEPAPAPPGSRAGSRWSDAAGGAWTHPSLAELGRRAADCGSHSGPDATRRTAWRAAPRLQRLCRRPRRRHCGQVRGRRGAGAAAPSSAVGPWADRSGMRRAVGANGAQPLRSPQRRHESGARSPSLQRAPSDAGTRWLHTAPAVGPALDYRRARQGSAARYPAADSDAAPAPGPSGTDTSVEAAPGPRLPLAPITKHNQFASSAVLLHTKLR
jgi:hypothetical protein